MLFSFRDVSVLGKIFSWLGWIKSVCLSLKMQTPASPPCAGGGMFPWTGMPKQNEGEDGVELISPNASRVVGLPLPFVGNQGKQLLWPVLPTLWLLWCCWLGHVQDGTSQWQAWGFCWQQLTLCTGDYSAAIEIQKWKIWTVTVGILLLVYFCVYPTGDQTVDQDW